MDRLERLLSLVHVLQSSSRPVPMRELRLRFPDYAQGSEEASRRKIERDKAELAEIGLVLNYVDEGDDGEAGYTLNRKASYLPDVRLTTGQRTVLATAARAALQNPEFPHRAALQLALAKLGPPADGRSDVLFHYGSADRTPTHGRVEQLSRAIADRKRIRITYRKPDGEITERDLESYAVFLKRGAWYACGRDLRSQETRVFRVSRIEDAEINPKQPTQPDYAIPDDFDLHAHAHVDPLDYRVHEPIEVKVRLDREVAFLGMRIWNTEPDDDGVFTLQTTHVDHVLDQVLAFGLRAELISPPEARRTIVTALERVLATHGVNAS